MCKNRVFIGILVFLLSFSVAQGAVVVGRVNIQKVLLEVNESKRISKRLKATFNKKKGEIQKEEKKIIKMQEDFKKQTLVMNDKAKQKRGREIERMIMELQQKTVKFQREIEEMENKYKVPILEKIRKVVDDVSKKAGVDFTYEASSASIVYSKTSKDLTGQVIKEYNKKHK